MTRQDCPECGARLVQDVGTLGWFDEAGREREGKTMLCSNCGARFGRDDDGRLDKASYVNPGPLAAD